MYSLSLPIFFKLGFEHITDLQAYDHIVFLLALLIGYTFSNLKTVVGLVTAFTIGHASSLFLQTVGFFHFPTDWIEFLIPVTIFFTAILPLTKQGEQPKFSFKYLLTAFFGLIHGAGFSNYISPLLGNNQKALTSLFNFNLGVEFGQLVIVLIILSFNHIWIDFLGQRRKTWNMGLGIISLLLSIFLLIKTWPF